MVRERWPVRSRLLANSEPRRKKKDSRRKTQGNLPRISMYENLESQIFTLESLIPWPPEPINKESQRKKPNNKNKPTGPKERGDSTTQKED